MKHNFGWHQMCQMTELKDRIKKKIIILMGIYIKSYNKHIAFEKKHLILVKSKDSNNSLFFHRV